MPNSIGKVSKLLNVPVHTVRFWTDEFEHISKECKIGKGNRRYYTEKAIEELVKIKEMLYVDKLTIQGVKQKVKYGKVRNDNNLSSKNSENVNLINNILKKISDIKSLIHEKTEI